MCTGSRPVKKQNQSVKGKEEVIAYKKDDQIGGSAGTAPLTTGRGNTEGARDKR